MLSTSNMYFLCHGDSVTWLNVIKMSCSFDIHNTGR